MSDANIEELVETATAKGKFSFASALKGRSYPTDTVVVWLDEEAAYPILRLDGEIAQLKARVSLLPDDEDKAKVAKAYEKQIAELEKELKAVSESLKASRYTFTVRGIDPGTQDDLLAKAVAEYPYEYDEYRNEITGQRIREEKASAERDRYYTNLLWQAHIIKIEDAEGNEDFMPDLETIAATRRIVPRAGYSAIAEVIDKVDMAVNWFAAVVDEGFLAKS